MPPRAGGLTGVTVTGSVTTPHPQLAEGTREPEPEPRAELLEVPVEVRFP